VEFAAADLPNFWLNGGTGAGTDTLRIQTYDGFDWSAPADITVTMAVSNQPLSSSSASVSSAAANADTFVFSFPVVHDTVAASDLDAREHDHFLRDFANNSAAQGPPTGGVGGIEIVAATASHGWMEQRAGFETLLSHFSDFHLV
jgi:hypothetical protein